MFRYAFLKADLCQPTECPTEESVRTTMESLEKRMGDEFPQLLEQYPMYLDEVRMELAELKTDEWRELSPGRSAETIMQRRLFMSCNDYTKVMAHLAVENGMDRNHIKYTWLVVEDRFSPFCPILGQQPAAERPPVHTLIAYFDRGEWFLLNAENPEVDVIPLGPQLPTRLQHRFHFNYPDFVKGQTLLYAGSFDTENLVDGFSNQVWLNIAASGSATDAPEDFICRK
ncbi:MAG: hypothetical protein AB7P49_00810 [Bdellovibrionales bacterium]